MGKRHLLMRAAYDPLSTEYLMTMDLTFDALNSIGRRIGSVQGPNIIETFVPPAGRLGCSYA